MRPLFRDRLAFGFGELPSWGGSTYVAGRREQGARSGGHLPRISRQPCRIPVGQTLRSIWRIEARRIQMSAERRPGPQGSRESRQSGPQQTEGAATPDPPMSSEGTVTILFSDMVDYAGMTERLGDGPSREILRAHHLIVRESLESHGGREIKVQGDGFMVAFGGVARALRCAVQIQRSFLAHSEAHGDRPIRVHIGIHTGEAVEEENDVLGHTVIVASRIADEARAGEIVVSALSEQMVERTGEFRFVDHREAILKGLDAPTASGNVGLGAVIPHRHSLPAG